jgi:RNA polymerase sigma factor (sigma-70 family)
VRRREPDRSPVRVLHVEHLLSQGGTAVHRLVMDDPGALSFESFYAGSRDRLARALYLSVSDPHLAAEAVDEAMARAFQRWHDVGTLDNPGGWVYRVALNWASSVRRRIRRAPAAPFERDPSDIEPVAEPTVLAAVSGLGVRQRAVVVCRFYLGLSEAETATALGIRPGTAKSRLHRALRQLETELSHLRPGEN